MPSFIAIFGEEWGEWFPKGSLPTNQLASTGMYNPL